MSELQNEGRECILITSGAVAFGKQKLAQEVMMSMSMRETIQQNNTKEEIATLMSKSLKKPNAAVGQSGLQALYETMFRNYGILVGQVRTAVISLRRLHVIHRIQGGCKRLVPALPWQFCLALPVSCLTGFSTFG